MGINLKPSRLIFGYRGKSYKFMSFFMDRRDNSFYFHIYRKKGETPMSCGDDPSQGKTLQIYFPSFKSTHFQENKISFHESGYIHSTDNHGKRYRDGVVGIPFKDIESFLFILVVAPKHPTEMIEIKSLDVKRDIQVHLKDDVGPFAVQFAIVRKGTEVLPQIHPEENLLGGFIKCEYQDKSFDLILGITKVLKALGLEEIPWPPFPLVLKRIG